MIKFGQTVEEESADGLAGCRRVEKRGLGVWCSPLGGFPNRKVFLIEVALMGAS